MDQDLMWFHGVPPGTNNFGTKTLRVNETGPSYEVDVPPATVVQQAQMEQYYMSALSECLDSPNVAGQNKLRRGAYEVAGDPERRKLKKEIDKAYRQRCKEKKMKTEKTLTVLTKENDKVKRENSQLRREEVRLQGIVQAQNETMKQLHREFGQLKDQLDRQNTIVEVLSKQRFCIAPLIPFPINSRKLSKCNSTAVIAGTQTFVIAPSNLIALRTTRGIKNHFDPLF